MDLNLSLNPTYPDSHQSIKTMCSLGKSVIQSMKHPCEGSSTKWVDDCIFYICCPFPAQDL